MKKGQAALEFISTYGWAMLVVLVMIGALGYFGVVNPSGLIPDRCLSKIGIACQEMKLSPSAPEFQIIMKNNLGAGLKIEPNSVNISCRQCNLPGDDSSHCMVVSTSGTYSMDDTGMQDLLIQPESKFLIRCENGFNWILNENAKIDFSFRYKESDNLYWRTASVDVIGRVEP